MQILRNPFAPGLARESNANAPSKLSVHRPYAKCGTNATECHLLESFMQQLSAPRKIHVICKPGPKADCHAFVIHALGDIQHFPAQGAPAPFKTLPNVPCIVCSSLLQSS
jgi:hypothetical protein